MNTMVKSANISFFGLVITTRCTIPYILGVVQFLWYQGILMGTNKREIERGNIKPLILIFLCLLRLAGRPETNIDGFLFGK
jgi:hypothetical protein